MENKDDVTMPEISEQLELQDQEAPAQEVEGATVQEQVAQGEDAAEAQSEAQQAAEVEEKPKLQWTTASESPAASEAPEAAMAPEAPAGEAVQEAPEAAVVPEAPEAAVVPEAPEAALAPEMPFVAPTAGAPAAAVGTAEALGLSDAPKKKIKPWIWGAIAAAVVIGIAVGVGAFRAYQSDTYDKALAAYAAGNYQEAAEGFQKLGDYEDASARYEKSTLWLTARAAEDEAKNKGDSASWTAASEAYWAVGDSEGMDDAIRCSGNADYYTALGMLEKSPTDRDTVTEALELFNHCSEIEDAEKQADYCENVLEYYEANDLYEAGHYFDAYKAYSKVSDEAAAKLGDVEEKMNSCILPLPDNGVVWRNSDYPTDSCELTIKNSGNPNAYYKLYMGDDLVTTVFVRADEQATFTLPSGVYSMNKGYGDDWYGMEDMFGDSGYYFKCNFGGSTTFELEANNGYEISTGGDGTGIGTQSARREAI